MNAFAGALCCALLLLAACGEGDPEPGGGGEKRPTEGDTGRETERTNADARRDGGAAGARGNGDAMVGRNGDAAARSDARAGSSRADGSTEAARDAAADTGAALDAAATERGDAAVAGGARDDAASGATDMVNVAVMGPYAFATFKEGAKAPEYAEGLVYHPTDAPAPYPAMVLSPGLTASNTDYEVWGRVLASHGIVVLLIQPTSVSDWNDVRAEDIKAALEVLKGLHETGPLAGKLDTDHVGCMGQSMGGGGTLIAANELGDRIQAAIPMQPYAPNQRFPQIKAPTLIIAAERDTVASNSSNSFVHYNSIPNTTTKIFLEGAGRDHYFSTDRFENDFEINARYAVAFLKVHLAGDQRYETYLYGPEHEAYQMGKLSRYLTSKSP